MSYTNLSDLKADFLSDQNILSSRELLIYMEQILYGTNEVETFFNNKQNETNASTNEDLYGEIKRRGHEPISSRYPNLASNLTMVEYFDNPPQEWDVATDQSDDTVGLYVRLDNQWVRRCEIGDDKFVELDFYDRGYRLNNV